uniref:Uncharacterized protein n=1 Tax=Tianjin Mitov tick virus 1 TaxID=2972192 RepID=A0A9E8A9C6_9VIRU|nr:MAG: hypothetical protein [Tianjin Mitov tick virus 1]
MIFIRISKIVKKLYAIFSITNILRSHRRYVQGLTANAAGRINFSYLRGQSLKYIIKSIIATQFWMWIITLLCLTFAVGVSAIAKSVGVTLIEYSWFPSLYDFFQLAAGFCSLSLGWLILVSFNHLNDLVNLYMNCLNHGDNILTVAFSHIWVVNFSIWSEFFSTMFTNPAQLLETRVVGELVLTYDTFRYVNGLWINYLIDHTSGSWNYYLESLKAFTIRWIDGSIVSFGHYINQLWTGLVSGIALAITPNVPGFIQPVVDQVFNKFATSIAISILVYIIRYLIGI